VKPGDVTIVFDPVLEGGTAVVPVTLIPPPPTTATIVLQLHWVPEGGRSVLNGKQSLATTAAGLEVQRREEARALGR